MSFRIVIAGESLCDMHSQACLVADCLSQNLPAFCYEIIEKPVIEWKAWLNKINQKNKWHHCSSPLIWKELLLKGSKPHYIGGISDFMEYCHSYYKFDSFINLPKIDELVKNNYQYKKKVQKYKEITESENEEQPNCVEEKNNFIVCISGVSNPLTIHLISGLLEMIENDKSVSKIYIFDENLEQSALEHLELECSFVSTKHATKVVKYVTKLGNALTQSDLLIILDYVPYINDSSIGDWLYKNNNLMTCIADAINASGSPNLRIIFPNFGPSCYNASILTKSLKSLNLNNIVVATSDLGMEVVSLLAIIANVPAKNIYCPPVWGFVGINHLVDIRTTIHRYDSFYPYERCKKVNNSTLTLGYLTPELRMLEYLVYRDETLWMKVAERKKISEAVEINKALAVLDVAKLWLFGPKQNDIINLGILCNGSFGLTFEGIFSQPARFKDGVWQPAYNYVLPKDPQINIKYLESIAELALGLDKDALPQIHPQCPPYRKRRVNKIRKHEIIRFME